MTRADRVDVAVVGGGPAGQALALALAADGHAVALLDPAEGMPAASDEVDLRVFALSPASIALLASLGAWPPASPLAQRACAYRRMAVWQDDPRHGLHLDAAALGWPALGWIVEHGVLQQALATALASQGRVTRHWRTRVSGITREADGIVLEGADGSRVRARLAVAADGGDSALRGLAGLTVTRHDYGQRGLVANVDAAVAHGHTARQRFLPDGPLAFLPLADGGCSIVWTLPDARAEAALAWPTDVFERELAIAAGGVLGRIAVRGARRAFPLARQAAQRYHAGRVVLVADAAHSVHPLAGQGLNLGLLDVAALAEVLADARDRGLDPGDDGVLARYARWRQGDNVLAARAFEAIDLAWRASTPGLAPLRAMALAGLQRWPGAQRRLVRHAAGLGGRVPLRCRPAWPALAAG